MTTHFQLITLLNCNFFFFVVFLVLNKSLPNEVCTNLHTFPANKSEHCINSNSEFFDCVEGFTDFGFLFLSENKQTHFHHVFKCINAFE